mmetsp:Transcript_23256/g.75339  ORF Transcript_23256/g.75339 Transcript_23256/m.75339 type:complete len:209 (+) Transcript_23256:205-831(+)
MVCSTRTRHRNTGTPSRGRLWLSVPGTRPWREQKAIKTPSPKKPSRRETMAATEYEICTHQQQSRHAVGWCTRGISCGRGVVFSLRAQTSKPARCRDLADMRAAQSGGHRCAAARALPLPSTCSTWGGAPPASFPAGHFWSNWLGRIKATDRPSKTGGQSAHSFDESASAGCTRCCRSEEESALAGGSRCCGFREANASAGCTRYRCV